MANCFSLTKPVPLGVSTNAQVIKANEYQSVIAADDLISAAQRKAEAIVANAERLVKEAVAEGFAKGMASAEQEIAKQLMAAKLRANQMMQSAEDDLVSLVKLTIERLFGGIDDDRKIVTMVQAGLVSMRGNCRVLIRVAPAREASILEALPEFSNKAPGIEFFEVLADAKLPEDMCILEGDGAIIKCSISEQLAKLDELIALAQAEP